MAIELPEPFEQIEFALELPKLRLLYLTEALLETVRKLSIRTIDSELQKLASDDDLGILASRLLRGEVLFAVPSVLESNPRLIGYYRLLLGYSQKTFYNPDYGTGKFKSMETKGHQRNKEDLQHLCIALSKSASQLLRSIDTTQITPRYLDDLTILTLGPQLRGGANNAKGTRGIQIAFTILKEIVKDYIITETPKQLSVLNSSGRAVLISLAPDPDITIQEELTSAPRKLRNLIAIEVKAGKDFSNIHNRIGEAEKSHQKAKADQYRECWTIVNVSGWNSNVEIRAKQESPSSDIFFSLMKLENKESEEYKSFRDLVISIVGIPTPAPRGELL